MTTQERTEIREMLDQTSLQVRAILRATAAHYHVTVERMCSVLKIAQVSHARQMAIYAMRELIKTADGKPLSYPKLGVIFGRDHSTAINAWRVIDLARSNGRRLEVDDYMRRMRSVLGLRISNLGEGPSRTLDEDASNIRVVLGSHDARAALR